MFRKIFISIILICLFIFSVLLGAGYYKAKKWEKTRQLARMTLPIEFKTPYSKASVRNFVRAPDGSGTLQGHASDVEMPQRYHKHFLWQKDKIVKVAVWNVRDEPSNEAVFAYVKKAIERNRDKLKLLTGNDYEYVSGPQAITKCDDYAFFDSVDVVMPYRTAWYLQDPCNRWNRDKQPFSTKYQKGGIYVDLETYKKNGYCSFMPRVFSDEKTEEGKQKKVDDMVVRCLLSVSGIEGLTAKSPETITTHLAQFVHLSDGSGYVQKKSIHTEIPQEYHRHFIWRRDKTVKLAMQIARKTGDEEELSKYIEKAIKKHSKELKKRTDRDYIFIPEPRVISNCDLYGYFNETDILINYQPFISFKPRCKRNHEDATAMAEGIPFAEAYIASIYGDAEIYIDKKTYQKNGVCNFPKDAFNGLEQQRKKQQKVNDFILKCLLAVSGIDDETPQNEKSEPAKAYLTTFARLPDSSGYLKDDVFFEVEVPPEYLKHFIWPKDQVVKLALQNLYQEKGEEQLYNYIENTIKRHGAWLKEITGNAYVFVPEPETISSCDQYGFFEKVDILLYHSSYQALYDICSSGQYAGTLFKSLVPFAFKYQKGSIFVDRETRQKNGFCNFPAGILRDVKYETEKQHKVDDAVISCILSVSGIDGL